MKTRLLFLLFVFTVLVVAMTSAQTLTVAPTSLAFGTNCILNTNNAILSYSLSGTLLTGSDITITAPANCLISFKQYSDYSTTLTLSGYAFPTLSATSIYVTFAPTSTTAYSDSIINVGGGATYAKVTVTGTGSTTAIGGANASWLRPTGSGGVSTMTWEKTTDGGATWAPFSNSIQNTDSILIPGNDSLGIDQAAVKGYFKLWLSTGKFASVSGGDFDSLSTVEYPVGGPGGMINISYGNLLFANNTTNAPGFSMRVKNNLTIPGTTKIKGTTTATAVGDTIVHTIGGDILITSTIQVPLDCVDGGVVANVKWNIGGSLIIDGAACRVMAFASGSSGSGTFNIGKDLIISNGQFSYASNSVANGPVTVNIKGNLTVTSPGQIWKQGGTITLDKPWVFNFCGTTEQVITNAGTIFGKSESIKVFWNVNNPAGIRIMNDFVNYVALKMIQGSVTMDGTSILSYTIPPASSYAESKLIYAGTSAQVTGTEYPAVNGPNGIEINNAAGVTLSAPRTITGNTVVTLTNGVFTNGSNLTFSDGAIVRSGGSLSDAPTFGTTTSVTYTTPTPAATITTGVELPSAVRSLTINDSVGVTLGSSVTVRKTLAFTSGKLTTGGNTLALDDTASVTGAGAGKYIVGALQRGIPIGTQSPVFNIGDATNYTPVTVGFTTVSTPGNLTVSTTVPGAAPAAASSISQIKYLNRNWTLTNSGIVFDNYGAKFTFVPDDIVGSADTSKFIMGKNDGGTWTHPTVDTITSTSIHAAGMTSMSDFAVGEPQTITATASAGGSILPSGAVVVNYGSDQRFTFTADVNHHLDSLMVDGVRIDSTEGYTFVSNAASHAIDAYFSIDKYTITATADSGGLISPSGAVLVNYGSDQRFTFSPSGGVFDSLFVDGIKVDSTEGYTFFNVTAVHAIDAYFTINKYTITATADSGGSISPSGAVLVNYGSDQRFTFAPSSGVFDSLLVDGIKVDSTEGYTFFNVTAAHTIDAYFTAIVTGISTSTENNIVTDFKLYNNFPNPFNPSTQLKFSVPKDGHVTLKVYSLIGQEVATLFDGIAKSGQFISKEFSGSRLSSGIYFARLQFNGSSIVQRMLLLK